MKTRTLLVYALLAAVWGVILVWQVVEHRRVIESARRELINRSRDISGTLGMVIRSRRHFVFQVWFEEALNEIVKSGAVRSVALLNVAGETVASAGTPINVD